MLADMLKQNVKRGLSFSSKEKHVCCFPTSLHTLADSAKCARRKFCLASHKMLMNMHMGSRLACMGGRSFSLATF